MKTALTLTLLGLCTVSAAHASSDDAWSQFQTDVGKACVSASKGLIENGKALVDPFGSENFGLAVVSGKATGGEVTISAICVYDKKTRKAEIGGEISGDDLVVRVPSPSP